MNTPRPSSSRARGRRPGPLLLLLLLPLVPAVLTGWLHPRRPDWPALRAPAAVPAADQLELDRVRRDHPDALWIDARPAEEYAAGHVPGALSLDEQSWEAGFSALADAWDGRRPIIVYCGGESCRASASVAERLRRELGASEVYVLRGGWPAWRAAAAGGETP